MTTVNFLTCFITLAIRNSSTLTNSPKLSFDALTRPPTGVEFGSVQDLVEVSRHVDQGLLGRECHRRRVFGHCRGTEMVVQQMVLLQVLQHY